VASTFNPGAEVQHPAGQHKHHSLLLAKIICSTKHHSLLLAKIFAIPTGAASDTGFL